MKDILSFVFDKLKKTVAVSVSIKQEENKRKDLSRLEHECLLFKNEHTGASILINEKAVDKKDEPEELIEASDDDNCVKLEFTAEHFNLFDSPEVKVKGFDDSKKLRSYRNDESILVGVLSKDSISFDTVTFDSMNVHYKDYNKYGSNTKSFVSLPSALTDGMDSLHRDEHMFFSGIPRKKNTEIKFILPLLPKEGIENIIP